MAAARQAGDHAGRDSAGNLEEATLEQLTDHVGRLASAYLTSPMLPLFGELVMVRNRAYELLERTERLSQRRDLYLVAGQLICLLGGPSCDLGHSAAAIEQARAARTYAELIGHSSLWAYASGMLSTFFSLDGQHRRALYHARAGLARLGAGSAAVRLHGLEALACSKLRLDDEAQLALSAATRARDDAPGNDEIHDLTGGMFTSTPAKQAYLAAMTYTNLRQPRAALSEASRAIDLWSNGPADECAGSALAVARIDVVDLTWVQRLDGPANTPGTPASSSIQPSLAAQMLIALASGPGDHVLEVGAGTGWLTALLSHRCGASNVTGIELDPELIRHARAALDELGYQPALIHVDGFNGLAEHAPYDRVLSTAAVPHLPTPWLTKPDQEDESSLRYEGRSLSVTFTTTPTPVADSSPNRFRYCR